MVSLNQQRILITRNADTIPATSEKIRKRGGIPIPCPMINITPPSSWTLVDYALTMIASYNVILFSSANAVRFLCQRCRDRGVKLREHENLFIAAIGPATVDAMRLEGLIPDFTAEKSTGQAFIEELAKQITIKKQRFLFPCSAIARDEIPNAIHQAGGTLDSLVVYENHPVRQLPHEVDAMIPEQKIDWITFTSPSTVQSFFNALNRSAHQAQTITCKIASIGPTTSTALRQCGYPPDAEASRHTFDGLLQAISQAITNG